MVAAEAGRCSAVQGCPWFGVESVLMLLQSHFGIKPVRNCSIFIDSNNNCAFVL